MKYQIHIIDITSRQYPFNIDDDDGMTLTVHDQTYHVTNSNNQIGRFYEAIINKKPFIVSNKNGAIVFNANNVIGIQVVNIIDLPELQNN